MDQPVDLSKLFDRAVDVYANDKRFTVTERSDSFVRLSEPAERGMTKHIEIFDKGHEFHISANITTREGDIATNHLDKEFAPFFAKGAHVSELMERAENSLSAKEQLAIFGLDLREQATAQFGPHAPKAADPSPLSEPADSFKVTGLKVARDAKMASFIATVNNQNFPVSVTLQNGKVMGFNPGTPPSHQPLFEALGQNGKGETRAKAFVALTEKAIAAALGERPSKQEKKEAVQR